MYKPLVIDAEFTRHPRELGGATPAAIDLDAVTLGASSEKESRRRKLIHDMIMRSINEDLARSFYDGNKGQSKKRKE